MIKAVSVRPVANLTDNSVRSIGREFAYTFGKVAEIAEILNTLLDKEDTLALFFATDPRPARIRSTVGFSPSGTEAVVFDKADFDAGGYFSPGNADKLTFPFGGVFRVRGYVAWSGTPGVVQLVHNETTVLAEGASDAEVLYFFKAGDAIQMVVDEEVAGGDHSPVLEVEFIRPSPNPPEMP